MDRALLSEAVVDRGERDVRGEAGRYRLRTRLGLVSADKASAVDEHDQRRRPAARGQPGQRILRVRSLTSRQAGRTYSSLRRLLLPLLAC